MQLSEQLAQSLQQEGIPFVQNEPMHRHTSFQIGGPAALFCTPQSPQQLAAAIQLAKILGFPYMPLGKGSNVLFCDEGYDGLVLHLANALGHIEVEGQRITAGAGANLIAVCRAAQSAGLTGLEFAYGIPGSLGGGIFMNAGAFDGELCNVLEQVTVLQQDGQLYQMDPAQLGFGYRTSVFQQQPWVITGAVLRLQMGNREEIAAVMEDHMRRRVKNQPLEFPSAGSTFKRPVGAYAGKLIDDCGLRGFRVGNAAVSEKHCGFVVNLGGASCADVLELTRQVADTVKQKTGFTLEKEVRVIGAEG